MVPTQNKLLLSTTWISRNKTYGTCNCTVETPESIAILQRNVKVEWKTVTCTRFLRNWQPNELNMSACRMLLHSNCCRMKISSNQVKWLIFLLIFRLNFIFSNKKTTSINVCRFFQTFCTHCLFSTYLAELIECPSNYSIHYLHWMKLCTRIIYNSDGFCSLHFSLTIFLWFALWLIFKIDEHDFSMIMNDVQNEWETKRKLIGITKEEIKSCKMFFLCV